MAQCCAFALALASPSACVEADTPLRAEPCALAWPLALAEPLVPAAEPGGLVDVQLANGGSLKAKTVILSTGARWRNVNVPGEAEYKNKGVAYCPHCDGPLFKGKRVSVIGGGNSGVEAAIDLAGIVQHVTLIEFADQLKADAVLVNKLKSLPNVTIHTNAQTTEITGAEGKVNGLKYKDRATGVEHTVPLEGVFVQIGLVPNTEWLKGTVELSKFGEIIVDSHGRTNLPGRTALEAVIGEVAPEFAEMQLRTTTLATDCTVTDLDSLGATGALRQAAELLLTQSQAPHLSSEHRARSRDALVRLFTYCEAIQA